MHFRVAVFDSHPIVHHGLTELLPKHGFIVVNQSLDCGEVVESARNSSADIVVTETELPSGSGLKVLEQLQDSDLAIPTVVYSNRITASLIARTAVWGARDFVAKSEPNKHLLEALRKCVSGQPTIPSTLFQETKNQLQKKSFSSFANPRGLTQREVQVLNHLRFGLSNREIAMSLNISVETAKEHVQNILRKQDFNDRTEAAVAAVRMNLA